MSTMNPIVTAYYAYILISIGLTIWVARTLAKNGRTFLLEAFEGREDLADSVNHLLVVGFYLLNLGYVFLALKIGGRVTNLQQGVEALSEKIGLVVIVLGAMHFFNLYVLNRLRRGPNDDARRRRDEDERTLGPGPDGPPQAGPPPVPYYPEPDYLA